MRHARLSEELRQLQQSEKRTNIASCARSGAFTQAALLAEGYESITLASQLVTIHRDLANARRNANLPLQLNTLGTDLQSVQARLEALVTSLGGGVYLEGEGWRR